VSFHILKMAEKVFFFDYDGDTRKVLCGENEIQTVDCLIPLFKTKYSDIEINTDLKFWTKDQTYNVRFKIESPQDIYNGAVLEVTSGSVQKRKREEDDNNSARKIPRVTGPRFVLRLRGLPWSTTQTQIKDFFEGIELVRIQFLYLPNGRASGDGLVELKNEEDMEKGMLKDKEHIGERFIEITRTTAEDMDRALGLADPNMIKDDKNKVLRMRGLPYSATENDVLEFLKTGDLVPERVHIITDKVSGRATGFALVEFDSDNDIIAALDLNRNEIGGRYIELFRGSMIELREALGVGSQGGVCDVIGMGEGGHGDAFIRMRGLPFGSSDVDIINFFMEADVSLAKIHRKHDGSEAIVELRSADVGKAMTKHKNYIGHRYVELYRTSFDEVADILGHPGRMPYRSYF